MHQYGCAADIQVSTFRSVSGSSIFHGLGQIITSYLAALNSLIVQAIYQETGMSSMVLRLLHLTALQWHLLGLQSSSNKMSPHQAEFTVQFETESVTVLI